MQKGRREVVPSALAVIRQQLLWARPAAAFSLRPGAVARGLDADSLRDELAVYLFADHPHVLSDLQVVERGWLAAAQFRTSVVSVV